MPKTAISRRVTRGGVKTEFTEVAKTIDIPEGSMKVIETGGKKILLARSEGRFYCADGTCPHLGGNLWEGTLHGTVITCPFHHSQFDLTNGSVIRWTDLTGIILVLAKKTRPPHPLRVYPVKIEGDRILVGL